MRVDRREPPRTFQVGISGITLAHCADVQLDPDEMVTFIGPEQSEYDVTRKSWGYYATPSISSRLSANGFRVAIVRSAKTRNVFVVLIYTKHAADWEDYAAHEGLEVILDLDDFDATNEGNCDVSSSH